MTSRRTNPVVVLIIFGLFSGILLGLAGHNLFVDEQFATKSLPSQATIRQGWITHGKKGSVHYHVVYLYRDRYFRQWTANTTVAQATYARLHVNNVVPVKYLDDETGRSRIDWPSEDQYHWHQDEVLLGIGSVIGVFAVLIFISSRPHRTWESYQTQ